MTIRCSTLCLSFALTFFSYTARAADDEYIMSSDEVYKIQTILIEKGYGIGFDLPDGKLGAKTRAAIAAIQKDAGFPPTGYLDAAQFKQLAATKIPTDYLWGAIGASTDGEYTAVWGRKSGIAAYKEALAGCRKNSNEPSDCIAAISNELPNKKIRWLAAVRCENSDFSRISINSGYSPTEAEEKSYRSSEEDGFNRSGCKIIALIATDGSHQK